jgi:DnaJ-class molecular chaperone
MELALGAKIPIQTLDGTVNLSIPKGSQTGKKLRLRGKGLPKQRGGAGDILVELQMRLPDTLSHEEEKIFRELARKSRFDPRVSFQQ